MYKSRTNFLEHFLGCKRSAYTRVNTVISGDGCLEWGLMAGLRDLPAMGRFSNWGLAGHSESPWIPQAPTFHLSEAAVN